MWEPERLRPTLTAKINIKRLLALKLIWVLELVWWRLSKWARVRRRVPEPWCVAAMMCRMVRRWMMRANVVMQQVTFGQGCTLVWRCWSFLVVASPCLCCVVPKLTAALTPEGWAPFAVGDRVALDGVHGQVSRVPGDAYATTDKVTFLADGRKRGRRVEARLLARVAP